MGSCVAKLAPGQGADVPRGPSCRTGWTWPAAAGPGSSPARSGGKYDPLLTGGNPNDDDFKLDHLPLVAERARRRREAAAVAASINSTPRPKPLNDLAVSQPIQD